ncbi:hypothetical protein [Ralstonia pseudosolanacearum]
MPWSELKPMDQRILFIADHLKGYERMSAMNARPSSTVTHVSELVCYLCG